MISHNIHFDGLDAKISNIASELSKEFLDTRVVWICSA